MGQLLEKRKKKQHIEDVKYGRLNNAIAKQVDETGHDINLEDVTSLEKEKKLYPRQILDSYHIAKSKEECIDITEGLRIRNCYKVEVLELLEFVGEEVSGTERRDTQPSRTLCEP